jgi:hypothetical protein
MVREYTASGKSGKPNPDERGDHLDEPGERTPDDPENPGEPNSGEPNPRRTLENRTLKNRTPKNRTPENRTPEN